MSPPLIDVLFDISAEGIARISINRPEYHNAFRPRTVLELSRCLEHAQDDTNVGVIILCGEGGHAFCSGGDQAVRGEGGYDDGSESVPRLRVLDVQVQMRRCPKPVIAMVAGYAIGGQIRLRGATAAASRKTAAAPTTAAAQPAARPAAL